MAAAAAAGGAPGRGPRRRPWLDPARRGPRGEDGGVRRERARLGGHVQPAQVQREDRAAEAAAGRGDGGLRGGDDGHRLHPGERARAIGRGPGTAAGRPSGPGAGMRCGAPETPTPGPRAAPQHPGGRARARKSPRLALLRRASLLRLASPGFLPPQRSARASLARRFLAAPGERVTAGARAQWPRGKGRRGMGLGEGGAPSHTHTHAQPQQAAWRATTPLTFARVSAVGAIRPRRAAPPGPTQFGHIFFHLPGDVLQ